MVNIKEATIDDLKAISEMNLDLFKFETQIWQYLFIGMDIF